MRRSLCSERQDEVTILFTDIEESSRLAERLGDRPWLGVLSAHNRLVRAAVRRTGGRIVKSQGDGFMVVFSDPGSAFDCAIAVQNALAERHSEDGTEISVRCGIHTGEVVRDGRDFFGRAVIVAARLTQCAPGGEIVASNQAVEAARLDGDLVVSTDERTLRGLNGRFVTHRIAWRDVVPQPRGVRRLPARLKQLAVGLK